MRFFTQFIILWSQTGLIKAVLLYFSTLFFCDFYLWIRTGHTSRDIWSLISMSYAFLLALQWTDKVVIVALSPHAENRPQDIHKQQNPQKFGIQRPLGTSDVSGSNKATLWFKRFGSTGAECFTCHAQSDVSACHRGRFYGLLLNKHTVFEMNTEKANNKCSLWVVSHSSVPEQEVNNSPKVKTSVITFQCIFIPFQVTSVTG